MSNHLIIIQWSRKKNLFDIQENENAWKYRTSGVSCNKFFKICIPYMGIYSTSSSMLVLDRLQCGSDFCISKAENGNCGCAILMFRSLLERIAVYVSSGIIVIDWDRFVYNARLCILTTLTSILTPYIL